MPDGLTFLSNPPAEGLTYLATYNLLWVGVSVLLSVFAAYAALKASERVVHAPDTTSRVLWGLVASLTLGMGVWAMHFVGMLALRLHCAVHYDRFTTLISMLPAVLAGAIALGLRQHQLPRIFCSLLLGVGIGLMHYIGMMAMHIEGEISYDPVRFALSILIAVGLAHAALTLRDRADLSREKSVILVAIVLGMAISAMHYVAMSATYFTRGAAVMMPEGAFGGSALALLVAFVTVVLASASLVLSSYSRDLEFMGHLKESENHLHELLDASPIAVRIALDDGHRVAFCNPAYNRLICEANALGRNPREYYAQPEEYDAILNEVKNGRQVLNRELELNINGKTVWALCSYMPMRYSNELAVLGWMYDITPRVLLESSLRDSEERFRTLIETASIAIGITHGTKELFVNREFCALTGYTYEELLEMTGMDFIHPDHRQLVIDRATARQHGESMPSQYDAKIVTKWGDSRWVSISASRFMYDGEPCSLAFLTDINERKRAEAEALEKESQYRDAIETSADGFWMADTHGKILVVNDAYVKMSGYSREELLAMHIADLVENKDEELVKTRIAMVTEAGHSQYESSHVKKDGSIWPVEISASYSPHSGGRMFVFITDLTQRKLDEETIWNQANYDYLTHLPNRRLFHDRLMQAEKKSSREGLPLALMLIDLDRFKEINDTLGHAKGDILLVEAANRIMNCVRESDTVARLGGDEFTVILAELEDVTRVERIAQSIIDRLVMPFDLGGEEVYISASIGISLYPNDAIGVEALLKNADQAMYEAKDAGRNRFAYFTHSMQDAAQRRLRLINDLRGALAADQFMVYYQPIVELPRGRIHKVEALIRWNHPELGMVNPIDFIPLAEETGLINVIGDWVFKSVVEKARRWRVKYHRGFQIAINTSPVQFYHAGNNSLDWIEYIKEQGLNGQGITVEITEGLLLHADPFVKEKLLAFRDAGIRVAIDDFGTGYSSLAYLKKFDIDYLKIDKSFVSNLEVGSSEAALCEAIIVMAHKLGLKVIAEGVETKEQVEILQGINCNYAQGYLYSRPIPAEEFEVFLDARLAASADQVASA